MKKQNKKVNIIIRYQFILIYILIATSALPTYAAPAITNVTGNITHGNSVTISGSGFGNHADYNNLSDTWQSKDFLNFRFKDFEDNTIESDGFELNTNGWTTQAGGSGIGTRYGRCQYVDTRLIALSAANYGSTGTWFTSFYFMSPGITSDGKFFRQYLGDNSSVDNYYLATGNPSNGTELRGFSECGASGTEWGTSTSMQDGTWKRVDVLAVASTGNLAVTTWLNGVQQWTHSDWGANLTYSPNGHSVDICNMIEEASGAYFAYDDIFIDYTQARVEIGNASTWNACTHKEIQIPQTWNSNGQSIAATINRGSFGATDSVWVYVVDSTGAVNSTGYPITFGSGGGGDTTPPSSPSGLSVS